MAENGCPEKACQQQTKDVHHAVFKKDGIRDQVESIKSKKVSWMSLWAIIPVSLIIIGGIVGFFYNADAGSEKAQDTSISQNRATGEKNSNDIRQLENEQIDFKATTTQQIDSINEKLEDAKTERGVILQAIKELDKKIPKQ